MRASLVRGLVSALCACLPCVLPAAEAGGGFSGDVGLGILRTQPVLHGQQGGTGLMPFLAFDYGPLFARIDTFGVKTLAIGAGHVELIGRYRADGYTVDGLAQRGNPVPVGLGTLQVTGFGAVEAQLLRDFGDSAGTLAQLRYIGRAVLGPVTFYPEAGAEFLDGRYANYYYGTRNGDVAVAGQHWLPGSAMNPFVGLLVTTRIAENWKLHTYARRTWLDAGIANSPLVRRGARNTAFMVLARSF